MTEASPRTDTPLRFPAHLRVECQSDLVVVLDEDGVRTISGLCAVSVCALIDGSRTRAEIIAAAESQIPDHVASMLDCLIASGIVAPLECDDIASGRSDFCSAAAGREIATPPPPTVALCHGEDAETVDVVRGALARMGARTAMSSINSAVIDDATDVVVAVVTDHLDPRLDALDKQCRVRGVPWLPVRASGLRQWLGPFFGVVVDGPCWTCLATAMRPHRRAEEAIGRDLGDTMPLDRPLPRSSASVGVAAEAVALEIDFWAHKIERPAHRHVLIHDCRTMLWRHHAVGRRPQCEACGDSALMFRRGEEPIRADPARQHGRPQESDLSRFEPLISPVVGAVRSIDTIPGPVPGTMLGRSGATPAPRPITLSGLRALQRAGNGGTGSTEREAWTSALGEALERWSGQFFGDELRLLTRRSDLGTHALDPDTCLLFDRRQRQAAGEWNAHHGHFNQIGPAVGDDVTEWSPLWSLRDGTQKWLPTAMLFYGAPGPAGVAADSNGCAAGATRDDAIRRGLLELIERDAVALWWYNMTRQPAVRVSADVIKAHAALGRDVWALDLTTDLDVPVVAAVSARRCRDGRRDRVMLGFGADIDPATALSRALFELSGTTAWVTEDAPVPDDPDVRSWIAEVDTDAEQWLRPGRTPAGVLGGVGAPAPGARGLVDRLVSCGLDPLVVDQTRPDVGLPVVRTVVPSLRPMWARFAPGRLFDVPVTLRRLSTPTPYEAINPRPVFL